MTKRLFNGSDSFRKVLEMRLSFNEVKTNGLKPLWTSSGRLQLSGYLKRLFFSFNFIKTNGSKPFWISGGWLQLSECWFACAQLFSIFTSRETGDICHRLRERDFSSSTEQTKNILLKVFIVYESIKMG
jgi:hypothetical protein